MTALGTGTNAADAVSIPESSLNPKNATVLVAFSARRTGRGTFLQFPTQAEDQQVEGVGTGFAAIF